MPFMNSRKKRLTKTNYQQIKIKKRLMDISLKVDHYVYNNRPMSATEAATYYHQVMSYQTLCKHDERSLQVIEKLARLTQAIIAEQTCNKENNGNPWSNPDNGSVSPVYSLTEDDKYELGTINNVQNENEKEHLPQYEQTTQCDTILFPCENEMPASIDIQNINKQHDGQGYIEQETLAIVDLTADENCNSNHDTCSELCSQSILNQIGPEAEKLREINLEECGQVIDEVDSAFHDLIIVPQSILENEREKKTKSHTIGEKTFGYNKLELLVSKNKDILNIVPRSILESNRENKTNIHTIAEKPIGYNAVGSLESKNNDHKLIKSAQSKETANKRPKSNHSKPIKQRKPRNKHVDKANKSKQRKGKAANLRPTMETESDNSNNINFETDLSWINNIKFVRQIQKDEYVTSLTSLAESLWENCYLPISWEDLDS